MPHIRIELQGDKYRLSINDAEEWVSSDGPMQEILVDMLNEEAPVSWFHTPDVPDPENSAMRFAVIRLEALKTTILTVAYNTHDPEPYEPDKETPQF
tara:strand:- start:751 stop:1041 length:291 start_codon:yes stop_codon:yes gene_type:complete